MKNFRMVRKDDYYWHLQRRHLLFFWKDVGKTTNSLQHAMVIVNRANEKPIKHKVLEVYK